MDWALWTTTAVVAGLVLALMVGRTPMDAAFMAALALLLLGGVLTPAQALSGFSNEGLATIAVLYAVVAGLRDTGATQWLGQLFLGQPKSEARAQLRLSWPVAGLSAVMNNTPVVAMMIPTVVAWTRRYGLSRSRLLMPLSYAAILGGGCTLIGTSTNLIVNGYLIDEGGPGMGLFEIAWVGLPVAVVGLVVMALLGRWLFPNRPAVIADLENSREYSVEMRVDEHGPLRGKTVAAAGLRHLAGSYLVEIHRQGTLLPAVSPQERLEGGDHLVFVGVPDAVVELQKIRGLHPATDQVFKLDQPRSQRRLVEAVVSERHPMLGQTIKQGRFRNHYGAVVLAAARQGKRLHQKPGDVRLKAGDTLLLECGEGFTRQHAQSRDFHLVSPLKNGQLPRHERAGLALAILVGVITTAGLGLLSIFQAALLGAGLMLIGRCTSASSIRRQVDLQLLVVIGAALGIGQALQNSGLAGHAAGQLLVLSQGQPWFLLALLYGATALLTAIVTNNAAAALMIYVAHSAAGQLDIALMPLAVTVMLAASASFITPMGYQTNLMVMGPGGYRFNDFLRAGLPMNGITGLVVIGLTPWIWPF
ncbi:di/tricarboxylate transporter [Natronospira proteinivora]|uniref:Di/tricarboxylate transporter n=1 Tax=Natronospira proteinivora TaxID=1807133 RepID=A0ABT1G9S6_9GAMM|nr:SLC13 family permease [Natronospira proteinivora]MCP1727797.1 di/tricarboxylate transporter [Natronospira proteinivora]